jgi:hypothetical protein
MRGQLVKDDMFFKSFAKTIADAYTKVIVPWWKERKYVLGPSRYPMIESYTEEVEDCEVSEREIKDLVDEYYKWDNTSKDRKI